MFHSRESIFMNTSPLMFPKLNIMLKTTISK